MGYELRREIRALLPPEDLAIKTEHRLTPLERSIILEIADLCGDDTRQGYPGSKLLQLAVGKPERAIEEALTRIATKWVALRVELGAAGTGRKYYSHRGKATTFRFPPVSELRAKFEEITGTAWETSPLASLPGAIRKTPKNPGPSSDQKPPGNPEKDPGFSGGSPREIRGPIPLDLPTKINTTNPSPVADDEAPKIPNPRAGGDGEFDSDQEQRINTLVAEILTLRPNDRMWTRRTIRAAIDKCLADGKPLSEIERAFPACAADPETKAPGRLPMDFYWWALPDPLVPFCATCNDTGAVPYGDGSVEGICQACNPLTDEMRGEFIRTLPNYPPCKDGIAGGNVAMPGYGWMYCPQCRRASGYVPTGASTDTQPRSSERRQSTGDRKLADALRLGDEIDAQHGYTPRRPRPYDDVPPGHKRRSDGSLVLVDSRDPRIDWDAPFRP